MAATFNCFHDKMSLRLVLLFITLVIQAGCADQTVFDQRREVETEKWFSKDFFRYPVEIQDTAIPYKFSVLIRNTTEYPYSNLYLFVRTIFPDDKVATDTLDFLLANPDGSWLGSGVGKHRDNLITVLDKFWFPQKGEYVFEIEQAMQDIELEGIEAVGIRIEKWE